MHPKFFKVTQLPHVLLYFKNPTMFICLLYLWKVFYKVFSVLRPSAEFASNPFVVKLPYFGSNSTFVTFQPYNIKKCSWADLITLGNICPKTKSLQLYREIIINCHSGKI